MSAPLVALSGRFFRAVVAGREERVLAAPRPGDCGRYHAQGQSALYVSPEAAWARLVAGWYRERDGLARVLFTLHASGMRVLDLGDAEACAALGVSRAAADASWKTALDAGAVPPSWTVADAVRAAGADGLIDRSRLFPGAWHVALFHWNEAGGPRVTVEGTPEPIE